MSARVEENSSNDKLVWGAKAIGEYLDLDPRQTFYQLEAGRVGEEVGPEMVCASADFAPHSQWRGAVTHAPKHAEPGTRGGANRVRETS